MYCVVAELLSAVTEFLKPQFLETPYNSNQKSFSLLSQTLSFYPRFLEQIFVSLGGLKTIGILLHWTRVLSLFKSGNHLAKYLFQSRRKTLGCSSNVSRVENEMKNHSKPIERPQSAPKNS